MTFGSAFSPESVGSLGLFFGLSIDSSIWIIRCPTSSTADQILGAGANAAPTRVAGVIAGGPSETTLIFSDLTESFVTPQSPNLFGFGHVTQVNDLAGNGFCASGTCELTYVFRDYIPIAFN